MFTSALLHAPTQCCCGFFGSSCSLSSSSSSSSSKSKKLRRNNRFSMSTSTRIVVVGDVHDDWNLQEDTKALQLLKPDLVLFTGRSSYPYVIFPPDVVGNHTFGDFGNENVALVRTIADLKMAKAVILGNHDAWGTQKFSQRDKDSVQLQLECLGEEHVGYRRLDFPLLKLSIVGGRPFSCGGQQLFRKKLLSARYGVHNMEGSANRICEAALGTPEDHSVIILAHNGPTGLGSNANDICGRDWVYEAGDHGDPDLARAISRLKENSELSLPLVVFGHMHKELALRKGLRKMIAVGTNNTVYLNGAIVSRVKRLAHEQGTNIENATDNVNPGLTPRLEGTMRAFTLVEILGGKLEKITETWVSVIGEETALEEEHTLFSSRN